MAVPLEHNAEAEYRLEQSRPCGHQHLAITPILLCTEHAALARAQHTAPRATHCEVCGKLNHVFITALESIR